MSTRIALSCAIFGGLALWLSVCSGDEIAYGIASHDLLRNSGFKDVTTVGCIVIDLSGENWPDSARDRIEEHAKREVRRLLPGIEYVSWERATQLQSAKREDLLLIDITIQAAGKPTSSHAAAYVNTKFETTSRNAASRPFPGAPQSKLSFSKCDAVCGFDGSRHEKAVTQAISGTLEKLADGFWESR